MPENDPAEFRPGARKRAASSSSSSSRWLLAVLLMLLVGGGAWWWYRSQTVPQSVPPTVATDAPADMPPAPAPAPATAASGPRNPVDAIALPESALPALADADARVTTLLDELLGSKQVASFLQVDGFVRRFVATVDNLARSPAPSRLWPVQPAPQRFMVQGDASNPTIHPDNGARYTGFVLFAESIDMARAAKLYARLYPLFQQAYEELGYPGRYFNDRLVAVIDHLLQAPEPEGLVPVTLPEVKGEMQLTRPWAHYEFTDPQLEALSSGQKIMVRVGLVNERRLKAQLREFRSHVATNPALKK
ncbi:DUF3014 domain-containing protein [Variovorax ginsengisoli]|uniref:DUF3014 domain-containing protein n=1 Tax=Variovorax ginsengisoli TaxID=363844 RepID=A0ABT9SAI7_9BURK|nr:DUF3014 domain-containing protein [Variovorax ginsengisoli]MDP9901379.1 hypothetical protein [Variovorax ginsengisoli]